MIIFLLVVLLVLFLFGPTVIGLLAMFVTLTVMAVIAIGCTIGWIMNTLDKLKRTEEEDRQEKARMMPTLYGP